MSTGIISSRYATALLRYAEANGDAQTTCAQAEVLEKALGSVPEAVKVLGEPDVADAKRKKAVLASVLGGEPLTKSMDGFLSLVIANDRLPFLKLALHSFIVKYYKSRNIAHATLVTAVPAPGLEEALAAQFKELTGMDVVIRSSVDAAIIGGFVFTLDDVRIDASVSGQLATLTRQFTEKNKRIV